MLGSEMVRTAVFGVRNAGKTKDGHIGRAAVCLGQSKNLFDAVKELDCGIANSAKSASSIFHKACKKDALINNFGKAAEKCSRNVNPLIWASAGIDVALAEDKAEALVENVSAIGTMRLAEEYMKKNNNLDNSIDKLFGIVKDTKTYEKVAKSKPVQTVAKKASSAITKISPKLASKISACGGAPMFLVKGIAFVAGSCLAYDIGKKFGDLLLGKEKES